MFEGIFQPWHLVIILAIVMVVFGVGKLGDAGGALGKSIREFRRSVRDEGDTAAAGEPRSTSAPPCAACGQENPAGQRFCGQCGGALPSGAAASSRKKV